MSKQHLLIRLMLGLAVCLFAPAGLATARPVVAQAQISDVHVSTGVHAKTFEPDGETDNDFPGQNDGVWVTFAYQDLPPGSVVTRLVRFGGTDYNWDSKQFGYMECCVNGGSGRYGFKVLQLDDDKGDLPGGDYEAFIYLNGVQVGHVAWGINGAGGRDDDVPGRPNDHEKTHDDKDAT